jgi:hypothetical protein
MRTKEELETTVNSLVYRRRYKEAVAKKVGICSYCPWHARENATRGAKHGHRKFNKIRKGKP